MTTFELNGIWKCLLAQWLTDECPTRRTNLIWLIVGLYLSQSVHANAIVKRWPLAVKTASLTRRLSRFLDNPAVRPAIWFRPVARQLLARAAQQELTLIVDASKVSAGHQLIIVALAYKKRALPLAWSWVNYAKGAIPTATQQALCKRVHGLLPEGARVILVGDSGFSSVLVLRDLEAWGWRYAVRQQGKCLFQPDAHTAWQRLDRLVTAVGQQVWRPQMRFTAKRPQVTTLWAVWQVGYERPWLLTTNLDSPAATRRAYARRMWIEEMFGDWKRHGWDIETTHLRHPDRLSRLVLAVALLYIWLVLAGQRLIRAGWRAWVDRSDRRDLSLFRIGLDVLQRCFTLGQKLPIPFPSLVGAASVR